MAGFDRIKPLKNVMELDKRLTNTPPENTLLVIAIDKAANKAEIRDVAFRHKLACQFMLTDHHPKTYQKPITTIWRPVCSVKAVV